MSEHSFFLGYDSFEQLIEHAGILSRLTAPGQIYITDSRRRQPGRMPMINLFTFVVTAAWLEENVCHYWMMRTGSVDHWDRPEDAEHMNEAKAHSERVRQVLEDHARGCGFTPVPAAIAFPRDLQLVEGATKLLDQIQLKEAVA